MSHQPAPFAYVALDWELELPRVAFGQIVNLDGGDDIPMLDDQAILKTKEIVERSRRAAQLARRPVRTKFPSATTRPISS